MQHLFALMMGLAVWLLIMYLIVAYVPRSTPPVVVWVIVAIGLVVSFSVWVVIRRGKTKPGV